MAYTTYSTLPQALMTRTPHAQTDVLRSFAAAARPIVVLGTNAALIPSGGDVRPTSGQLWPRGTS